MHLSEFFLQIENLDVKQFEIVSLIRDIRHQISLDCPQKMNYLKFGGKLFKLMYQKL